MVFLGLENAVINTLGGIIKSVVPCGEIMVSPADNRIFFRAAGGNKGYNNQGI